LSVLVGNRADLFERRTSLERAADVKPER